MGWRIAWRLRRARCMRQWPSFGGQAQGLAAIRGREWVAEGRNVKVSVADVRVEHDVNLGDFYEVAGNEGVWPRDVMQRQRIREIRDFLQALKRNFVAGFM